MKAATLFSGIGAPETAMPEWQWLWAAEISPFPSAVLAARHPSTVNLGDVTADDFITRAAAAGRPDVLVFGSPCQSFSVAGKRLGLDDPRGNLALVALGISARLKPRWIVFENVPGLLSSAGGRDFGLFLRAVEEAGYLGCWRVLDAQWFGLAQRRQRVFFVGRLGTDWRGPAAVLLEPQSLCGDHPPRRRPGEGTARTVAGGARVRGGQSLDDIPLLASGRAGDPMFAIDSTGARAVAHALIPEVAGTMPANAGTGRKHGHGWGQQDWENGYIIPEVAFGGNNTSGPIDVATAVRAKANGTGHIDFESETFLVTPFDTTQITSAANYSNPQAGDPCHPLAARAHPPAVAFDITGAPATVGGRESREGLLVAFSSKDSGLDAGEVSPTLRAMNFDQSHANGGGQVAVAFDLRGREGGAMPEGPHDTANIRSAAGGSSRSYVAGAQVRRLTPVECERLQGFPDGYTAVEYRGKPAADGPRYAALGNSMAVPVMRWILDRIQTVDRILARRHPANEE